MYLEQEKFLHTRDYRLGMHNGKICRDAGVWVPDVLVNKVIEAVNTYTHPGVSKTVGAFQRKFYTPLTQAALRDRAQKVVQGCTCATTKPRGGAHLDNQKFFPVPTYPFASIAIDFVEYDYLMEIVDGLTGYVLALPCRKKGLMAKKAAELFLERCVFLMGLPKDITADNAGTTNGNFWDTLSTLSGMEQCKTEGYRPSSNGRAERAVQTVSNTLRNFLEQSRREGSTWPQLLPQALWGLNDLPGVISGFSPHRLLFGREPVGSGDVAPLVDKFDGAEEAKQFSDRLVEERTHVQSKLTALHKKEEAKFLKKHPS